MKKLFLTIVILFSVCAVSYSRTWAEVIKQENRNVAFGGHFGAIGQAQDLGLQIYVFNLSVYGFYFDIGLYPQDHASDVRVDVWDADQAFLCHFGYQLPISKYFTITPLIGYANDETGYTDGGQWYADDRGIHNKFVEEYSVGGFDYGAQVSVDIPISKNDNRYDLILSGTYTKYCWYGGIGFKINF